MTNEEYVKWRFDYWWARGDLSYAEIDAMVDRGELLPGVYPPEPKDQTDAEE